MKLVDGKHYYLRDGSLVLYLGRGEIRFVNSKVPTVRNQEVHCIFSDGTGGSHGNKWDIVSEYKPPKRNLFVIL